MAGPAAELIEEDCPSDDIGKCGLRSCHCRGRRLVPAAIAEHEEILQQVEKLLPRLKLVRKPRRHRGCRTDHSCFDIGEGNPDFSVGRFGGAGDQQALPLADNPHRPHLAIGCLDNRQLVACRDLQRRIQQRFQQGRVRHRGRHHSQIGGKPISGSGVVTDRTAKIAICKQHRAPHGVPLGSGICQQSLSRLLTKPFGECLSTDRRRTYQESARKPPPPHHRPRGRFDGY